MNVCFDSLNQMRDGKLMINAQDIEKLLLTRQNVKILDQLIINLTGELFKTQKVLTQFFYDMKFKILRPWFSRNLDQDCEKQMSLYLPQAEAQQSSKDGSKKTFP